MVNYTQNDQNKDGLKLFRLRKFYMREFINTNLALTWL